MVRHEMRPVTSAPTPYDHEMIFILEPSAINRGWYVLRADRAFPEI